MADLSQLDKAHPDSKKNYKERVEKQISVYLKLIVSLGKTLENIEETRDQLENHQVKTVLTHYISAAKLYLSLLKARFVALFSFNKGEEKGVQPVPTKQRPQPEGSLSDFLTRTNSQCNSMEQLLSKISDSKGCLEWVKQFILASGSNLSDVSLRIILLDYFEKCCKAQTDSDLRFRVASPDEKVQLGELNVRLEKILDEVNQANEKYKFRSIYEFRENRKKLDKLDPDRIANFIKFISPVGFIIPEDKLVQTRSEVDRLINGLDEHIALLEMCKTDYESCKALGVLTLEERGFGDRLQDEIEAKQKILVKLKDLRDTVVLPQIPRERPTLARSLTRAITRTFTKVSNQTLSRQG